MPTSPTRTFKNEAYGYLSEVGKALSSPARLEMLGLLAQAPRSVEVLANEIDQTVANTSQHLQILRRSALVKGQRDGQHMVYRLASPEVVGLLGQLHGVAAGCQAALERLSRDFFEDLDGLEPVDRPTLIARLRSQEVLLLDVRPKAEYEAGHIVGAMSIPLEDLEARMEDLPRDRTIVAYCRGPFCAFSAAAARRLREAGFDARRADISVLDVGIDWACA
jgi:rhodanese-related sulfurtransferase